MCAACFRALRLEALADPVQPTPAAASAGTLSFRPQAGKNSRLVSQGDASKSSAVGQFFTDQNRAGCPGGADENQKRSSANLLRLP
jgi:hypothetical protein